MKDTPRRSFLRAATAVPALTALAQSPTPPKRPFFMVDYSASRPGKSVGLGKYDIMVKVSGDDTGGEFALLEVPAGPNAGPPLHMHHVENELFWVLEGELDVQVGTEIIRLTPGSCAYAPRLIPHTWQAVGERDVRFLTLAEPAGHLEAFMRALTRLRQSGPLDPASTKALFEKYDMEVIGPALSARRAK
jgi:mannose-6-phosphate isomerase-like protein (cupin superfamily)